MKLYRVGFTNNDGHQGYAWESSKENAEREARDYRLFARKEGYDLVSVTVERYDFPLTATGVRELLAQVATYPNNG